MLKNLVFVIKANQEFIRHPKGEIVEIEPELNTLFESISDIYLPLLSMLEKYESEKKEVRIGLVVPPVLCTMLDNPEIQNMYVAWLDSRIDFGSKEISRCKDKTEIQVIAKDTISKYENCKKQFSEKYENKLLPQFVSFHNKGLLELLGTTGTDIFFPHYQDLTEILSAEIETGLQTYRHYFGEFPEGFWIPELAYVPGIEKLIKGYGYSYTILDSRSILLSETLPQKGIFYPCRADNSLAIFAADPELQDQLFSDEGFVSKDEYLNMNRDIGYELSSKELESLVKEGSGRIATGFRYWSGNFDDDSDEIYNKEEAMAQVAKDAQEFLKLKSDLLNQAETLVGESNFITLVCPLDAEKLHQNWNEWLFWLDNIIEGADKYSLNITTCKSMLNHQYAYEKVVPYYSSWAGTGYGENFLSSKNSWMMRYSRKACERMIDLADRFPNDTGLKTRLLNLGSKELLLALSCGLAKMIDEDNEPEYAKKRFVDSINAFTDVFDSLGSNTVSTEWLTTLEIYDDIFPWINYRIFSKKK